MPAQCLPPTRTMLDETKDGSLLVSGASRGTRTRTPSPHGIPARAVTAFASRRCPIRRCPRRSRPRSVRQLRPHASRPETPDAERAAGAVRSGRFLPRTGAASPRRSTSTRQLWTWSIDATDRAAPTPRSSCPRSRSPARRHADTSRWNQYAVSSRAPSAASVSPPPSTANPWGGFAVPEDIRHDPGHAHAGAHRRAEEDARRLLPAAAPSLSTPRATASRRLRTRAGAISNPHRDGDARARGLRAAFDAHARPRQLHVPGRAVYADVPPSSRRSPESGPPNRLGLAHWLVARTTRSPPASP